MVIRSVPRRAAAVAGALLAGLLLVLTGCATGGGAHGSSSGTPRSTATVVDSSPRASGVPDWARGMPVVPVGELPSRARDTLRLIDADGPLPYDRDGMIRNPNTQERPKTRKKRRKKKA